MKHQPGSYTRFLVRHQLAEGPNARVKIAVRFAEPKKYLEIRVGRKPGEGWIRSMIVVFVRMIRMIEP